MEIIDAGCWFFLPLCGFVQQGSQARAKSALGQAKPRLATYLGVMQ